MLYSSLFRSPTLFGLSLDSSLKGTSRERLTLVMALALLCVGGCGPTEPSGKPEKVKRFLLEDSVLSIPVVGLSNDVQTDSAVPLRSNNIPVGVRWETDHLELRRLAEGCFNRSSGGCRDGDIELYISAAKRQSLDNSNDGLPASGSLRNAPLEPIFAGLSISASEDWSRRPELSFVDKVMPHYVRGFCSLSNSPSPFFSNLTTGKLIGDYAIKYGRWCRVSMHLIQPSIIATFYFSPKLLERIVMISEGIENKIASFYD